MSTCGLSATQIAIIGAAVMIVADVITLVAAVAAYQEEQKAKEESNRDIESQIKYLQGKLRY